MSYAPVMRSMTSTTCKIGFLHGIAAPLKWPSLEGTPRGSTAARSTTVRDILPLKCDVDNCSSSLGSLAGVLSQSTKHRVKALSSGLRGREWEPEQGHMMKLIIQLLVAGAQGFYYQKSLIS